MIADAATTGLVHAALEYAGMALGFWLYRRALRREAGASPLDRGRFAVVVGAGLGAALGNKLVYLVERPDMALRLLGGEWAPLGQSLVGGLLGGLLGVEIAKALTGQRRSTGDAMVLPLAAGIALGRLGCFLAGLHDDTYGLPSTLPWAVDHGDGVPRHPSALYEAVLVLGLAAVLRAAHGWLAAEPGLAFKLFLAGDLAWRLIGDSWKPVRHPYPGGGSGIQWVCLLALIAYAPFVARAIRRAARSAPPALPLPDTPSSAP